jgi:aspartyl-tRNA(Asn)/glutamyl-tRNA(Gln) amidotransferase subunit A
MLQIIAGHHPSDPSSSSRPVRDFLGDVEKDIDGLHVGVMRTYTLGEGTDPRLCDVFDEAVAELEKLGASVTETTLPLWHEMSAAMMITTVGEGGAYHHNDLVHRWGDYFHKTRTTISWGALISATDYVQAQRVRRAAQRQLRSVFDEFDAVITPTVGATAPRIESLQDVNNDVLARIQTPYWSAVGAPAVAVPMGFVDGLPVSMQIAGRAFDEPTLVRIAHAYQQVTDWHLRVPELAI